MDHKKIKKGEPKESINRRGGEPNERRKKKEEGRVMEERKERAKFVENVAFD